MANKRIQKKRAKVAAYQKRVNLIAQLAVWLCPDGTKMEKRRIGLALWKREEDELALIYWQASLRRMPFRRGIMRRVYNVPVAEWRPITAMMPSTALDRLMDEVRR